MTTQAAVTVANLIKLPISKTVEQANGANKREQIGEIAVYCPSLAEFGIEAEPTGVEADGALTYASDVHNFLYGAIVAAVKTATRNKFQPGSDQLRVGAKIAETLAELVAPSTGNKGAALVERRALMDMFKQWVASTGRNEAVQKMLAMMLDKTDNLLLQDTDKRGKIKQYFVDFGNATAERLTDWQANYLSNAISTCDGEELDF